MNTAVASEIPGRAARLLAILSVACFWLLPYSPVVALGALSTTQGASGRSRRLAVCGAVLCAVYTVVMAVSFVRFYLQVRM